MRYKMLVLLAVVVVLLLSADVYADDTFIPLASGPEALVYIAARQMSPGGVLNVVCNGVQLIVEQLSPTTAKLTCSGSAAGTPTVTPTGIPPTPTVGPTNTPVPGGDPVLVGAGDIAGCGHNNDEATAKLLDAIAGTVFTMGDNAYPDGAPANFTDCYNPTWGRHKARTQPAPGNHDYHTANAGGYFGYFGAAAHGPNGYYSYDLGQWHIIALNTEIDVSANSAEVTWLKQDLAAHPKLCTLAYWHEPRWSSGALHGSSTRSAAIWTALYAAGVDVVVNGHDHEYERFGLQNPNGQSDPKGIREFVAGTGGAGLYSFGNPIANSEVRNNTTFGVLKLTLRSTGYDWQFVPVAGSSFTDSGSGNCVS